MFLSPSSPVIQLWLSGDNRSLLADRSHYTIDLQGVDLVEIKSEFGVEIG